MQDQELRRRLAEIAAAGMGRVGGERDAGSAHERGEDGEEIGGASHGGGQATRLGAVKRPCADDVFLYFFRKRTRLFA